MSGWTSVPLIEVAPPTPSSWRPSPDQDVWLLNLDQIEPESGDVLSRRKAKASKVPASTVAFDNTHVLYSKLRPNLNKVVLPNSAGYCTSELLPLKPDSRRLDRRYLAHYLRSRIFVVWAVSRTDGAKMPRVKMDALREHRIPLPELVYQRRIAAILDKADAIRTKRREAMKLANEFLRSVFLDMFGDPLTNSRGLPLATLGNLCTIRRGASPRPINDFLGGEIPWIKIGDATSTDDVFITRTAEHVTEAGAERSVRLKPGAFVFANCGVSLGFARILKIEGCIHDGWLAFEDFSEAINQYYLLALINILTPTLRRIAPDGTQPNLNTGIMRTLEIPLPLIEQQERFADIIAKARSHKKKMQSSLAQSDLLFQSLQQQAFTGQL